MGGYIQLAKPRIGVMIALTAVTGYLATAQQGEVDLTHLLLLALAMMMGSASSSIFNHFYDRDIDRLMTRTSSRPFAKRQVGSPQLVLWVAASLLIVGCGIATYVFNPIVATHLFLGAFFYGVVYTIWLKRRNWLNIVIGGLAGSFAVLAGAAAVNPDQWLLPMLLAIVLFFWTPSHFWALAMRLKDQYAAAGVPMLPVVVGNVVTARYILINSILLVGSSLLPWFLGELGNIYGVGAVVLGAYLLKCNIDLIKSSDEQTAMTNFFASMKYLGGLFVVVIMDVHLPI
ncbi:Protoheme IX farnesyltransferase 1 [Candidatus Terasakiella magnetica]|uniref:Protoheme IX farnesyltransferase n=1 Tax=Candidatus Terasakiella magnetica TaxID=1867952 RepID=A0A1C3RC71_9PROT|nr:heme o synthase [Candidatus Terasakiella magnetica]SCA54870.1 Protoheme IX farnesyltransferase 1 [Candidatus Terasakiella magnetica]